ncbi:MAG: ATP-binding protein [Bacteroidales bacterium]|nr:ATP-binding protein [Bacteroidales bacterium]
MAKIKYPIGIQTFQKIRQEGYLYIDKTKYIFDLVDSGTYYFLSRPRRFGKSLLISTLEAYFQGQKELFEGLTIYDIEKEWKKYPVLHFDLNIGHYSEPDGVYQILNSQLSRYESEYGKYPHSDELGIRFDYLLRQIFEKTGSQSVILIDEYDKPILQTIGDEDLQAHFRAELKPFYGCLKSCDRYIKFSFLTGVTKIGKLSVFSDLNNLIDISMEDKYAQICGITRQEIETALAEPLQEMAQNKGVTVEEMHLQLKKAYDGYRFSWTDAKVYNPFSLLSAFRAQRIDDYWFETGTPTFLVKLLQKHSFNLWEMDGVERQVSAIKSVNSFASDPIPVIYQSGYLTIKEWDEIFNIVSLGYPNAEVRRGFINSLLPCYAGEKASQGFDIRKFVRSINDGNVDGFMRQIQALFADIPYVEASGFNYEGEFRNVLYIVFSILGFYAQAEKHIGKGRVDLVVKTASTVYVMEFKLDGSVDEAMAQINSKSYAIPFTASGKKIVKVAAVFSKKDRNLTDWKIETS